MARLGRAQPFKYKYIDKAVKPEIVSYALTQVYGTGTPGSLSVSLSSSLSQVAGTGTPGTIVPAISFSATQVSGTGMVGSVSYATALMLTPTQAIRLEAIFRRHGLIDPLVITPTSIGDGTLTMTRAWDGTTETDTTTALPATGSPTAALVDKLARHYGLIDPVAVTTTSRTDGTFSQTIAEAGTTITVTP